MTYLFVVAVNVVSTFGFFAMLIAGLLANFAVAGSAQRSKAVTVVVTAIWPVIVASALAATIAAMDGNMFTASMDMVRIVMACFIYLRFKDEDNWWSGRGKKMLDGIDKFIEKMTPNVAGAGA